VIEIESFEITVFIDNDTRKRTVFEDTVFVKNGISYFAVFDDTPGTDKYFS